MSRPLEEYRRLVGLVERPALIIEKKGAGALGDFRGDLDHDYADLVRGLTSGGDLLTSAIARLRGDLDAIEKAVKGAKKTPLLAGADATFVEAFAKNMRVKGQWTRSIDEWQATMHAAIQANLAADVPPEELDPKDDTYNGFKAATVARWLKKWDGIEVQPAREYSVALYIKGPTAPYVLAAMLKAAKRGTKADEAAIQADGTLRLWWD
jgi:hypothetical protein